MRHFALTLTPEGQVTLPAEARDALGIAPGERLSLVVDDEGRATLQKPDALHHLRSIARRARADAERRRLHSCDVMRCWEMEADSSSVS